MKGMICRFWKLERKFRFGNGMWEGCVEACGCMGRLGRGTGPLGDCTDVRISSTQAHTFFREEKTWATNGRKWVLERGWPEQILGQKIDSTGEKCSGNYGTKPLTWSLHSWGKKEAIVPQDPLRFVWTFQKNYLHSFRKFAENPQNTRGMWVDRTLEGRQGLICRGGVPLSRSTQQCNTWSFFKFDSRAQLWLHGSNRSKSFFINFKWCLQNTAILQNRCFRRFSVLIIWLPVLFLTLMCALELAVFRSVPPFGG